MRAAKDSLLLAVLLVAGCEVSTPIVSSGKDTYVVTAKSSACIRCTSASTALQRANAFCARMGKSLVLRSTSGYMNPFGYDSSNQLVFSCLDESSADASQPASANGTIFVDPAQN